MALTFFLASFFGILPIIFWLIFFLWQDFKKPEPLKWLLLTFLVGVIITPLVWLLENYFLNLFGISFQNTPTLFQLIIAYFGIATIEEGAKFFGTAFLMKKNRYFNEAIDAMIYLIVLALGFGLVENILAASQEIQSSTLILPILEIMSLRFIGANLLHALSSGFLGFCWAQALLKRQSKYLLLGFVLSVSLHAFFNLAIIKFGSLAVLLVSGILFIVGIFLLWAFDLLKKIKKPLKYSL